MVFRLSLMGPLAFLALVCFAAAQEAVVVPLVSATARRALSVSSLSSVLLEVSAEGSVQTHHSDVVGSMPLPASLRVAMRQIRLRAELRQGQLRAGLDSEDSEESEERSEDTEENEEEVQDSQEDYSFAALREFGHAVTDLEPAGIMHVGSPSQALPVAFDTGSESLWLCSASMGKQVNAPVHVYFNESSSTSAAPISGDEGGPMAVASVFASGAMEGDLYSETVAIAGMSFAMKFGLARKDTVPICSDTAGLLGLSPSAQRWQEAAKRQSRKKRSAQDSSKFGLRRHSDVALEAEQPRESLWKHSTSFWDAAPLYQPGHTALSHKPSRPLGFYFAADPFTQMNAVTFGVDARFSKGSLAWLKSASRIMWAPRLYALRAGTEMVYDREGAKTTSKQRNMKVLFDTGTAVNVLPARFKRRVLKALKAGRPLTYVFNDAAGKPVAMELSAASLRISPGPGGDDDDADDMYAIQFSGNTFLLGQVFLRQFYTVYDPHSQRAGGEPAIGVARANHAGAPREQLAAAAASEAKAMVGALGSPSMA